VTVKCGQKKSIKAFAIKISSFSKMSLGCLILATVALGAGPCRPSHKTREKDARHNIGMQKVMQASETQLYDCSTGWKKISRPCGTQHHIHTNCDSSYARRCCPSQITKFLLKQAKTTIIKRQKKISLPHNTRSSLYLEALLK